MLRILFFLLAMIVPGIAMADVVIHAPNGNTWDLYVFGNARVIADTLESVKLLMSPDKGETGYATLMLFMATLGFLVLAVRAGFNPSQGFVPMFTYILIAWAVSWGTTTLKVNVHVLDTVDATAPVYTVQKAPAIVALPAVLVSQVGHYFTETIEKYFTAVQPQLKLTGDQVNGFNIFNRMMQEANQFTLTDANLKQSLRAYMADCTVPAIAAGRFKGSTLDQSGTRVDLYGINALLKSDNLLATLETANFKGVYTKYYPMDAASASAMISVAGATGDVSPQQAMSSGVLVACDVAYGALHSDIENHAEALFNASSSAWSKTGTQVQLDQTFSAALAQVGSVGGASKFSAFGSPQTFIAQQAVINSMSGSFRQAATQTGNNEFLTAANIAQAEQNQKSAWAAGFTVFNNMMGYVYSVLQAFIFAIMPVVVIALFVPGLGKGIFTNYGQILIWLSLWSPMLAIINYLVTIFGYEQIGSVYALNGGPNYQNTAVVSEKTNDLVLAAQFLGISTPLITWGLVKGALAFTEFIQSGIGSSFAQQAGASTASGNMSMGNISMNSTNMDKFNTAMSSTVGFQQTAAFSGTGAMQLQHQGGGNSAEANGGKYSSNSQMVAEASRQLQSAEKVAETFSMSASQGWSKQQTFDYAAQTMNSQQFGQFLSESAKAGINYADEQRVAAGRSASQSDGVAKNLSDQLAASGKLDASISLRAGAGASMNANLQRANTFNKANDYRTSNDSNHGSSRGETEGRDGGRGSDWKKSLDGSTSVRVGDGQSVTWGEQLSAAVSYSKETVTSASEGLRNAHTIGREEGVTTRDIQSIDSRLDGHRNLPSQVQADLAAGGAALAHKREEFAPATALNPTSQAGMHGFGAAHAGAKAAVNAGTAAAADGAAAVAAAQPKVHAQENAERNIRMTKSTIDAQRDGVTTRGEVIAEVTENPSMVTASGSVMNGLIR